MLSVKGKFQNGVAQPNELVTGHDGQTVIITFLEEGETSLPFQDDSGWDALMRIIERSTIDTGVEDLAHQHDHYLYGKSKQD